MADWFAQNAPKTAAPPPVDWFAANKPRRDSVGDAFAGLAEGAGEMLGSIPDALLHPIKALESTYAASKDQYDKAVAAAGPAGDNKGDLAGFLQHTAGMFPVIGPMASNLMDALVDGKADAHEIGRQIGSALTMAALPEVTKRAAPVVVDGVKAAAPVVTRAVKAAAPDVAAGTGKMAAGYVASKVLPHEAQTMLGYPMYKGATQIGRGLRKGYDAARNPPAPPAAAAPPTPAAAAPPAAAVPPVGTPVAAPLPQGFVAGVPVQPPVTPPLFQTPPAPQAFTPGGPVRPPLTPPGTNFAPYIPNYGALAEEAAAAAAPPVAAPNVAPPSIAPELMDAGRRQFEEQQAPPAAEPAPAAPAPSIAPEPAAALYHGSPNRLESLAPGSMMTDSPEWAAGYTTRIQPDGAENFSGPVHSAAPQFKNPAPEARSLHDAERALLDLAKTTGKPFRGLQGAARLVHDELGFDGIVARNAEGKVTGAIPFTETPVENYHDPRGVLRDATAAGRPIASNMQAALDRAEPAPAAAAADPAAELRAKGEAQFREQQAPAAAPIAPEPAAAVDPIAEFHARRAQGIPHPEDTPVRIFDEAQPTKIRGKLGVIKNDFREPGNGHGPQQMYWVNVPEYDSLRTFRLHETELEPWTDRAAAQPAAAVDPAAELRAKGEAQFRELRKTTPEEAIEDRADAADARRQFHGEEVEWANRQRKADRFTKHLKAADLDPTPENIQRAARELAERELPSPETVEMIQDRMGYTEPEPAAAPVEDDLEALLERSLKEARRDDVPEPEPAPAPIEHAAPKAGDVRNISPDELHADPVRFQYKANTGGAAGVGDELKGIGEYDPELGGVLSVWIDPADGKTYVVNGHHRLELAKRAGAPEVTVRYLKAANAAEARLKGAVINIAEGRGTALDAAKIFRDHQMEPADVERHFKVSLKGAIARDGVNLSKLAPQIFTEVVQGDLPVQRAAMIGELLPNHPDQLAALEMVRKAESSGKNVTNETFRELIEFVRDGPMKEAAADDNFNLFGEMEPQTVSAALEMAELSSYVRKRLASEKRLFGTVADVGRSKMLEAAGNQLLGDKNVQMAEIAARDLAVYDKLKTGAGPINDVLRSGAEALGKGAKPNEIRNFTFERIRSHVDQLLSPK
jgi:hypothetical protein